MADISHELSPLASHDSNLPPPDQTPPADQLDGWEGTQPGSEPDLTMGPHRPSLSTIVIDSDSDVDPDESDDDGCDTLHHNQQESPPGLADGENSNQNAAAPQTAGRFPGPLSILFIVLTS